jgi:hypothetical protein
MTGSRTKKRSLGTCYMIMNHSTTAEPIVDAVSAGTRRSIRSEYLMGGISVE